jgi:hypothetical protein
LEDKGYRTSSHTEEKLKRNTQRAMLVVPQEELLQVNSNTIESECIYRDSIFSTT